MEELFGLEHGAYIWGRSVHNIRIKRLWCDVTHGFGRKWSNFFLSLEFSCGLRPDEDTHVWLLHHLFLDAINQDARDWAQTWKPTKFAIENLEAYGIDWEEFHDAELMAHHAENNEEDEPLGHDNPFANEGPHRLSHMEVVEPSCPLSVEELQLLNSHLSQSIHSQSRSMISRRAVWVDAFEFCSDLYATRT
ncbi:hypothetical protein B0H17DRAFT_1163291 [Mycena rosella]|uniref:Integrase core domain-containing protein n=1 Tax=Mycena rosella TaxID=1033263 RepID=A0AAD7G1Z3_MYCRO|nr:hypothetical protein B0H17DRAFT_1163291 [Mycena rosella]